MSMAGSSLSPYNPHFHQIPCFVCADDRIAVHMDQARYTSEQRLMVNNALTSNVRDANGGDVAVTSQTRPFTPDDLSFFSQLKDNGTITNYTAVASATGSTTNSTSVTNSFSVLSVNPNSYPIVTSPTFVNPGNGSISSLLTGNGVIVDTVFADQYSKKIGDTLTVHVGSRTGGNERAMDVKIVGIVTDSGTLAQSSGVMLVSSEFYNAASPSAPVYFDTVYVTTTDQAHTDQAVKAINAQFPLASQL